MTARVRAPEDQNELLQYRLSLRLGPVHARQRLGIEQEAEARVFGRDRRSFHLENVANAPRLIRFCLQAIGLFGRARENSRKLTTARNTFTLPDLPEAFEGFRILHLTDLHVDMDEQNLNAVIDQITPLDYDLCVLTGDYRKLTWGPIDAALEGMARLRGCALPIFGGLSAAHFEDREGVTNAGIEAKHVFVEEFYRPSLEFTRRQLKKLEAGELSEDDVPLNLLQMIATQAHETYADEDVGIKEAILFFVATTGTSAQAVLSTVEYLLDWFEKYPDDRALVEDMEFISNALQEALRLRAPFVPFITRLAVDDVDAGTVQVKAGDEVQAWVARAGRDAAIFGEDANEFNPKREVPEGISRYGLAFATGAHQCLGLRAVLGNDGKSGSHLRLVQGLFRAGIRRDPQIAAQLLPLKHSDDPRDQIPTYISFPVILDNWSPRA